MTLVRLGLAAAAALIATASSASAADPPKPSDKLQVYVCERPTPAKHVQHRDGGRLQFVSARELLNDASPTARPRCITQAELERYRTLYEQQARIVAAR